MKYVPESLSQFYNYNFFKLLEKKEDDKTILKKKEKDGLEVIEKIKDDFEKFKKDANGLVVKYKEFWEENKKIKERFSEEGNIYKMYDDDYVVGVLKLSPEIGPEGNIESGFGNEENDTELIEGPEINPEKNIEDIETTNDNSFEEKSKNEAIKENDKLSNLGLEDIDDIDDIKNGAGENTEVDMDNEKNSLDEIPPLEEPEEESANLIEPQEYFVVYDISGDEREEIFRCGSSNVIKAFKEFYNDIFKDAMKNVIIKYKEIKKEEKRKIEQKEKEKREKEKEKKFKTFLKRK